MKKGLVLVAAIAAVISLTAVMCSRSQVVHPPLSSSAIVIEAVDIFDVRGGKIVKNQDVLLHGESILSITPSGQQSVPEDAIRISGRGRTLLPGFVEMHGHLSMPHNPPWETRLVDREASMVNYLNSGVTSILEVMAAAKSIKTDQALRKENGLLPKVYSSGPGITAPNGHPLASAREQILWWLRWYVLPRIATAVSTEEEVRSAVHSLKKLGVNHIKLVLDDLPPGVPVLSATLAKAVVDEVIAMTTEALRAT